MLKNRLKGVKGNVFLTRGSDDYDHKGLKKALRASARDSIAEQLEDVRIGKQLKYRIVIYTYVYENYGAHNWDGDGKCPQYWKFKGGNEYHLPIEHKDDLHLAGLMVDQHRHKIERNDNDFRESIGNWVILSENEKSYEEEREAKFPDALDFMSKEFRETGWLERAH